MEWGIINQENFKDIYEIPIKRWDPLSTIKITSEDFGLRTERTRYYGHYSNKSRGLRKKAGTDDQVPALIDSDMSSKAFRKNWARLIQKIYHVDPLLCPKCQGKMRIISWIEDEDVIEKILKHLGLWLPKRSPPPRAHAPPQVVPIDYLDSQIPSTDDPSSGLFIDHTSPPSSLLLDRDRLKKSNSVLTGQLRLKMPKNGKICKDLDKINR